MLGGEQVGHDRHPVLAAVVNLVIVLVLRSWGVYAQLVRVSVLSMAGDPRWRIPMRPDHGHELLDDHTRAFQDALISGPPPLGPGAPARGAARFSSLLSRAEAAASGQDSTVRLSVTDRSDDARSLRL